MGYIINEQGVIMDEDKVRAVKEWPQPKSSKTLRGFLGLARYYRKIVRGFGKIVEPSTQRLKQGAFVWSQEALKAIHNLKSAVVSAPILSLVDFSKQLIIEWDASNSGVCAVLQFDGKPIAFFSKALHRRNCALLVFDKEL